MYVSAVGPSVPCRMLTCGFGTGDWTSNGPITAMPVGLTQQDSLSVLFYYFLFSLYLFYFFCRYKIAVRVSFEWILFDHVPCLLTRLCMYYYIWFMVETPSVCFILFNKYLSNGYLLFIFIFTDPLSLFKSVLLSVA